MKKINKKVEWEKLDKSLHTSIASGPNVALKLESLGFCLHTSPQTFRAPTPAYHPEAITPKGMRICGTVPEEHDNVNNDNDKVTTSLHDNPYEIKRRLNVFR